MSSEENEVSEMWKDYREDQRNRRAERLPVRTAAIMKLEAEGFKVLRLTEYQFRINGVLDLYPIHNRFHDIKKNKRGGFRDVQGFVRSYFKPKGEPA